MAPPSLPPANPDEHQYWTDPILCEETQARLEYFRSLGWLPPNYKPKTLEGLAVIKRYWQKYCIQSNEDYVEYLLLEDQAIYMNFFDWMYKTSWKKLLQLYDEYWQRLCQYFGLFARRRLNGEVHEQMRRFLKHVFPAERQIARRTKKKNTLDVDVFCVTYRHHWIHSRYFRHGSMIIQFKASLADKSSLGKCKRDQTFQSDLPKHVSLDDLPDTICYCDIELFYLKDPDSKRDVLCAIIEFHNLRGRPEGADGTKFFMHGDYQLAFCLINQIISYAFRDRAFFNTALTPELIWRLQLGRDARFEDDISHYNYRRWTANEVNRNFTSQEQKRVLGQSGDAVFEKHYQSEFIRRDLQHVVLLQPSQEGLLRLAGSMLRKRDLSAPYDLTDGQRRAICQKPTILELRREKRELIEEMRSLAGTVQNVKEPKELSQLRKTLANDTQETARKEHFHNAPVLEVDRQIKQLLGQSDVEDCDADSSGNEDWELLILKYVFPERARLVENFYGPEAENFNEDKLLARHIQVTKDMVALMQLCEPNRRGNRFNWNMDGDESEKSEEPLIPKEETLDCSTDVCIICYSLSRRSASNPPPHKFPSRRKDSLRRHLIDFHLACAHDGISCTWGSLRRCP
ncbi:uncharacterized protein ASPGLDRAFT_1491754 [Aspergillus glaucus CBS 516.65]|uniref:FluG domain-containing protein n=1 Tax=Aspergillus glaucus CBS 516.65 TaxID=1160497 RepID=A0A1L9VIG9_ASPGL|nr:hypothetical protein ASPGLDRAFT_1491754 [Aspergillus glaucus CBS 516.65]OJJ83717.1 hypothetical protein ASPGLDRAFT_1491754 [Aspergillus glaucus CBS 516.65]